LRLLQLNKKMGSSVEPVREPLAAHSAASKGADEYKNDITMMPSVSFK
jgi:hypothetical protein